MQKYRYLVKVQFIETEEIKTYRVKTTLAGVERWFSKNFKEGEAVILSVEYDKNQD